MALKLSRPYVFRVLELPKDLTGHRILDVGAGASDTIARLLDLRADAYAIDPRFRSRSEIKGNVLAGLREGYRLGWYDNEERNNRQEALERFMQSIKSYPERYKIAQVSSIPFPDRFFDTVFSIDCILSYLDVDRRFLVNAIRECLRVVKMGGTIQLVPFNDSMSTWPDEINRQRFNNGNFLVTWARGIEEVSGTIITPLPNGMNKLTIIKVS